jgi:hypothetical protein
MQISNDTKLNMADGVYKDFRGPPSSTSLRDPSDVGVIKSYVEAPHLHHLACPSTWSNYWPLKMT